MLRLPDALPELPENLIYFEAIERDAIQNRLDVQIARLNLERMAKNLKLTQLNPFISSVEVGALQETSEGLNEAGYELELSIPIFDAGGVQNAKARTVFEQAEAQAEVVAIAAASESRQAFVTYQTTWHLAKDFGGQLIPLRQRVSQERLLMYNGMLISVFDLLADVRSAASLESDYVDAVRDFWLADAYLQSAVMGTGSRPMIFEEAAASVAVGEGGADH
jgi:outer membrane protein TolC